MNSQGNKLNSRLEEIAGVGTVYVVQRQFSREYIENDLRNIAEAGLKTVTIWPALTWWDTECQTTLFVLDCAQKYGLKVILELVGQNPGYELIPDKDLKPEYLTECEPKLAREINFNHPEVQKITAENLKYILGLVKDCPALMAYDIWNETYFNSTDKYTAAEFHKWLENKYGSIEDMNEAWETSFDCFTQADPKRCFYGANTWACLQPGIDWLHFQSDNLAGMVRIWTEIIKDIDPDHPVMVDNGECSVLRKYDDWKTAATADVFGTTYYPLSALGIHLGRDKKRLLKADMWLNELILNSTRSAANGKPWVLSELQSHIRSAFTPSGRVEPEDLGIWLWQAFATGCKSVTFWKWRPFKRGRQSSGRGLTLPDGSSTERLEKVSEVAKTFNRHHSVLTAEAGTRCEAAILHSQDTRYITQNVDCEDNLYCRKSAIGWFKIFWEKAWNVDYVRTEDIAIDILNKYKVIAAPGIMLMSQEQLAVIKKYVECGGTFIADGRFALMNNANYCYEVVPGDKEFSQWAGYNETDIYPPENGFETIHAGDLKLSNKSLFSLDISADEGVEILGTFKNGKPAIIKKNAGKGQFIYCAFDLAYNYFQDFPEVCGKLLTKLTSGIADKFHIEILDDNRLVSRNARMTEDGLLVFLINYGKECDVNIKINESGISDNLEMIEGNEPKITITDSAVKAEKQLAEYETCVFLLKGKK